MSNETSSYLKPNKNNMDYVNNKKAKDRRHWLGLSLWDRVVTDHASNSYKQLALEYVLIVYLDFLMSKLSNQDHSIITIIEISYAEIKMHAWRLYKEGTMQDVLLLSDRKIQTTVLYCKDTITYRWQLCNEFYSEI